MVVIIPVSRLHFNYQVNTVARTLYIMIYYLQVCIVLYSICCNSCITHSYVYIVAKDYVHISTYSIMLFKLIMALLFSSMVI